ncbi:hypothetical protein Bind_1255 [Beijerinckia indica subsp. indica ATCC 9039]|uniref:Uncharacterized protein n=1 Tax=Beijerinckia indica subsp. indica (strain ATCC 9039 / DSM 1715 / NCIMB 8712) TaxID=395963 RepID=B2IJM4_BEII9|nr:hypothetical protein Bind_1255 [Beijerinckia indica subsp. indica ATCC 9039]
MSDLVRLMTHPWPEARNLAILACRLAFGWQRRARSSLPWIEVAWFNAAAIRLILRIRDDEARRSEV